MADVICLDEKHGEKFSIYHGDCVSVMRQLPDESIDFSVYSPPFGAIFVYSDSAADMGNSTDEQFAEHYAYAVREKFRLTKPGRLTAVHCSDLPMQKWKDGAVGIKDFSGQIIKIHEEAGWIYHSRRTIWKSPVTEMARTKHVGLLYKQLRSDSAKSRGGMPDYLLTFVKPGDNANPIKHTPEEFPLPQWQEWASPVWMTIDQTDVLNVAMARTQSDERHLCPLQMQVIERAITMWSNPGDIILSMFSGIGSEGVGALKAGRKFLGIELKGSYFKFQGEYLDGVDRQKTIGDLFAGPAAVPITVRPVLKTDIPSALRIEFLDELIGLCKKKGIWLGHEDSRGAFLLCAGESTEAWLREAREREDWEDVNGPRHAGDPGFHDSDA